MFYDSTVKNSSNIVSLSFSFFPVYAIAFLIMLPLLIVRSADAAEWTGKGEDPTKFEDPKNWNTMRVPDQDEEANIKDASKIIVYESRIVKQLKLTNATIEMKSNNVFLGWLERAVLKKSHLEVNGKIEGASLEGGSSLFGASNIDISDVVFRDSTIRAKSVILVGPKIKLIKSSLTATEKVEIKGLVGDFDNKESVIRSPTVVVENDKDQNIRFRSQIIPLENQDTVTLKHLSGNKLALAALTTLTDSPDNKSPDLVVENFGNEININRGIKKLVNYRGRVSGNAKITDSLKDNRGEINAGESPGMISADNVILDNTNMVFEIQGLLGSIEYDQILSNALLYGNSLLNFDMQQGPSFYTAGSEFHLFVSSAYEGEPSAINLNAQGTSYEGLSFARLSPNYFKTGLTPHNQYLLYHAGTGTLSVEEVPGPLPIMGVGCFAFFARRLRKRSSRLKTMEKNVDNV